MQLQVIRRPSQSGLLFKPTGRPNHTTGSAPNSSLPPVLWIMCWAMLLAGSILLILRSDPPSPGGSYPFQPTYAPLYPMSATDSGR